MSAKNPLEKPLSSPLDTARWMANYVRDSGEFPASVIADVDALARYVYRANQHIARVHKLVDQGVKSW